MPSTSFAGCKWNGDQFAKLRANNHNFEAKPFQNHKAGCQLCKTNVTDAEKLKPKPPRLELDPRFQQSKDMPRMLFPDLVKALIPDPLNPDEKLIRGCQVFLPETVFFASDGRVDFCTALDKDCCLIFEPKIKALNIKKRFKQNAADRKTDDVQFGR